MTDKARYIAEQLVMHRTQLVERLTAPGWGGTHTESKTAEKNAQDYIYRIIAPILKDKRLDD